VLDQHQCCECNEHRSVLRQLQASVIHFNNTVNNICAIVTWRKDNKIANQTIHPCIQSTVGISFNNENQRVSNYISVLHKQSWPSAYVTRQLRSVYSGHCGISWPLSLCLASPIVPKYCQTILYEQRTRPITSHAWQPEYLLTDLIGIVSQYLDARIQHWLGYQMIKEFWHNA